MEKEIAVAAFGKFCKDNGWNITLHGICDKIYPGMTADEFMDSVRKMQQCDDFDASDITMRKDGDKYVVSNFGTGNYTTLTVSGIYLESFTLPGNYWFEGDDMEPHAYMGHNYFSGISIDGYMMEFGNNVQNGMLCNDVRISKVPEAAYDTYIRHENLGDISYVPDTRAWDDVSISINEAAANVMMESFTITEKDLSSAVPAAAEEL